MSNPQSGRVALVTGTSSGIGLSTAVQLAQQGFSVIATMRDTSKAEALEARAKEVGVTLDLQALEVQDDASVNACVQYVLSKYGHIDLLVNNAGSGYFATMEQVSMQDLRRTMEINFFGVWRVTQAVFPSMRAAHSGRIVTVTSVGGLIGQPFNDAYCAAKFAVEGYMESFVPVARRLGVDVVLIEPGPVNTNFVASTIAQLPQTSQELRELYMPMVQSYMGGSQERFATIGQTPDQVAEVIVEAAMVEKPHFRYPTSEAMQGFIGQKFVDTTGDRLVDYFEAQLG